MTWQDFAEMLKREADDCGQAQVSMILYNLASRIERKIEQMDDEGDKLKRDLDQLLDPNN